MEKSKENVGENQQKAKSALVWDCGSTLYDSFELNSFKRQLDSAISSRSLSMPHLSDRRVLRAQPVPPQPPAQAVAVKKSSKFSRSINKLLRSVFRTKPNSNPLFRVKEQAREGFFVVYEKSGALTTIPEVPEIDFGGFSPEIGSLVRKTGSERFTATNSIGISCA